MSLRTRKSKRQKLNRRKSLKIGGNGNHAPPALRGNSIFVREYSRSNRGGPIQPSSNSTSTPSASSGTSASSGESDHSQDRIETRKRSSKPPTPSANRSAQPPTPSVNISSTQLPTTNSLCNISEGDLVKDNMNKIAYVTKIDGPTATLSNGDKKKTSDLAKYEYHDILTSLSNILNFVLTSKNTPPGEKDKHIAKINALKATLNNINLQE